MGGRVKGGIQVEGVEHLEHSKFSYVVTLIHSRKTYPLSPFVEISKPSDYKSTTAYNDNLKHSQNGCFRRDGDDLTDVHGFCACHRKRMKGER
jgi:hypothetical protein